MYGIILLTIASCVSCGVCLWRTGVPPLKATREIQDLIDRPLIKRQLESETGRKFTDVYTATRYITGGNDDTSDDYYYPLPLPSALQYALYIVEVQVTSGRGANDEYYLLRIDSFIQVGSFSQNMEEAQPDPFRVTGWTYEIRDPFLPYDLFIPGQTDERSVLSGYKVHHYYLDTNLRPHLL